MIPDSFCSHKFPFFYRTSFFFGKIQERRLCENDAKNLHQHGRGDQSSNPKKPRMVNGSCSSSASRPGRRARLRGERFGAHSAHQYFTLPCGHGRHSAQNRSSFPCLHPTHATQLSLRLPCGHGLHVAQLSFRFPCGHRFITSRSPLYHRRPRARGRVRRDARSVVVFVGQQRSIRQRGKNSPGRVLLFA